MTIRALRLPALLVALALVFAGCGGDDDSGGQSGATTADSPPKDLVLRLGTKNFTEQYILGELYRQALEARGFKVDLKPDIGSSEIVDAAMRTGSLDMYPEYTGVLLSEIARKTERPPTPAAAYDAARAFSESRGFTMLDPTPFSDSNALAVKPAVAKKQGISSIADLEKIDGGAATIAAPPEFRTRFEGLQGLDELYGLDKLKVRAVMIGKQYETLDKGLVDAAAVFTTDGKLGAGRYRVLRDPENVFSFQNVAPVVNAKVLARAPGIRPVLNAVSAKLTTQAMREMNAAVDLDGKEPAAVAKQFLQEQGLL